MSGQPSKAPEQWAQRILARVEKQRSALLEELESLVRLGKLGCNKGEGFAEISIEAIRRADRLCKRHRAAIQATGSKTP